MAHAKLSPSSAKRWMTCPGSVELSKDRPDESSSFADEGTDAHELAARCLESGKNANDFLGETMGKGNVVGADMAYNVQAYVDYVRNMASEIPGAQLLVEQRLPIGHLTGEEGAKGTADVVILGGEEIIVVDLKYGRGVAVEAEDNPQLQIYGLGAVREFGVLYD